MTSLKLPAKIENLAAFMEFVADCAARHGCSEERMRETELVLEEALVNVFNYAYPGSAGDVEVRYFPDKDGSTFIVEIEDSGIPFDLRSAPPPDLTTGLDDRKEGGLGVHFIKQMAEQVEYQRLGDRNILRLTLRTR